MEVIEKIYYTPQIGKKNENKNIFLKPGVQMEQESRWYMGRNTIISSLF